MTSNAPQKPSPVTHQEHEVTHLNILLAHIRGEAVQRLCRRVRRVGLPVGARRQAVIVTTLVRLDGRVAIYRRTRNDRYGSGLDPHQDGLSLKHPHLLSQVPVGLNTTQGSFLKHRTEL